MARITAMSHREQLAVRSCMPTTLPSVAAWTSSKRFENQYDLGTPGGPLT